MGLGAGFYYFSLILLQIFSFIFVIRIISFKRNSWVYYLLATSVGSLQIFSNHSISIVNYLDSIGFYTHDILLSLVGIIVFSKFNIQPKKITNKNKSKAILVSVLTGILMLIFTCLVSPVPSTLGELISDILVIFAFIGCSLLVLGFIVGLLINALFYLQSSIVLILCIASTSSHIDTYINFIFYFAFFLVFLFGYVTNLRKISIERK